MCSIEGTTDKSVDIKKFTRYNKSRGPDATHYWSDHWVQFGHNYLQISPNPERKTQPFVTPKGNVLLFNGEIYGLPEGTFDTEWLGRANKATVSKDSTTIIDAQGSEESINQRVALLKDLIEESQSPFEKENLQNRLAKFIGGVAIVHVGGHTEIEMKEKKDRVEDAIYATKAALRRN